MNAALRRISLLAFVMLSSFASTVAAQTHKIHFGNEYGRAYVPNHLILHQGDIVVFEGDFATYPLQFDSIPSGVELPNPVRTGSSFSYAVRSGGHYYFSSTGFSGMFSVIPERISVESEPDTRQLAVYPVPALNRLSVELGFPSSEVVSVELYDSRGRTHKVTYTESGISSIGVTLDRSAIEAGIYFLYVNNHERSYQRKVIVE